MAFDLAMVARGRVWKFGDGISGDDGVIQYSRLTDHLTLPRLAGFAASCRAEGLLSGLAGSLSLDDIPALAALGCLTLVALALPSGLRAETAPPVAKKKEAGSGFGAFGNGTGKEPIKIDADRLALKKQIERHDNRWWLRM